MQKYKNLIFDLGGVIVNYDLEADTRSLHAVGLPTYSECCEHPELSSIMNNYLNGLTPWDDFRIQIRPYCIPTVTDEMILSAMDDVMGEIPIERLKQLIELRKTHRVYLLSNICQYTWERTVRKIQALGFEPSDLFDQLFLSFEMQLAKPDPRIYQSVIEATGIIPQETLFLDDTQINIDAARRLGIDGEVVEMNRLKLKERRF